MDNTALEIIQHQLITQQKALKELYLFRTKEEENILSWVDSHLEAIDEYIEDLMFIREKRRQQ